MKAWGFFLFRGGSRGRRKPKGRGSVLLAERGEEDGETMWIKGLERLVYEG